MADDQYVAYEAVNEGARVFVASSGRATEALLKAIDLAEAAIGDDVIFHGAYTTFEDENWVATVVAA